MSRLEIDLQVPLDRFDLSVSWNTDKGRLGLFGPSGSGKSTLLESIAGLRRGVGRMAFEGRLWLDSRKGICLPPEDRRIGYVPQDSLLFPHRDVLGNLLSGRRRVSGDVKSPAVEKVIGILGLEELLPRSVATLSGGEKRSFS